MTTELNEKTSLVEQIEEAIVRTIREGGYAAGDSLPSELELTESLGVSRAVVREALSRLRMLGLLESRKKRGMILCEPDVFAGSSQVLNSTFLSHATQRHLAEMRLILEMGFVDLVFARKTDEDIARLKVIAGKLEKATTDKRRIGLEITFHTELYRIVDNPLLLKLQALLQPFFEIAAEKEREGEIARGEESHRALLQELESGSLESFRRMMKKHLESHFQALN